MFDKLKFWKSDEAQGMDFGAKPDLGSGSVDSIMSQNMDPLAQSNYDPLQQGQDVFDRQSGPLQGSFDDPEPGVQAQYPQAPTLGRAQAPQSPRNFAQSVPQIQPQYESVQEHPRARDMELVLAKLDALKSELDSVHQRIRKIEESTDTKSKQRYW